jgi:hypothetical protein
VKATGAEGAEEGVAWVSLCPSGWSRGRRRESTPGKTPAPWHPHCCALLGTEDPPPGLSKAGVAMQTVIDIAGGAEQWRRGTASLKTPGERSRADAAGEMPAYCSLRAGSSPAYSRTPVRSRPAERKTPAWAKKALAHPDGCRGAEASAR